MERNGIFSAFSRSRYLTKGARWKIFGLQFLLLILVWLLTAVLGVVMVTSGMMSTATADVLAQSPLYLISTAVTNTLIIAFWSTAQASLYAALRNWKDGPQSQDLADIFA